MGLSEREKRIEKCRFLAQHLRGSGDPMHQFGALKCFQSYSLRVHDSATEEPVRSYGVSRATGEYRDVSLTGMTAGSKGRRSRSSHSSYASHTLVSDISRHRDWLDGSPPEILSIGSDQNWTA